jgi:hypothetical protein
VNKPWTFALAMALATAPVASLLAAGPGSEPANDHKPADAGSGDTTMKNAAPGYQSKSAIDGPVGQSPGNKAAQAPTNTSEANSQPPTTATKSKGP